MAPKPSKTLARKAAAIADPESFADVAPLGALKAARSLSRDVAKYEERLVLAARRQGASWADVAEALGCGKASAHERYAHLERNRG